LPDDVYAPHSGTTFVRNKSSGWHDSSYSVNSVELDHHRTMSCNHAKKANPIKLPHQCTTMEIIKNTEKKKKTGKYQRAKFL
jgi:hypothetical protein